MLELLIDLIFSWIWYFSEGCTIPQTISFDFELRDAENYRGVVGEGFSGLGTFLTLTVEFKCINYEILRTLLP